MIDFAAGVERERVEECKPGLGKEEREKARRTKGNTDTTGTAFETEGNGVRPVRWKRRKKKRKQLKTLSGSGGHFLNRQQ